MEQEVVSALTACFGIDGTEIRCGFGDYRKLRELPDWYGIPNVKFIWHSGWVDPELYYKGHVINSTIIEDSMWSEYREFCEEHDVEENYEGFDLFMEDNVDSVYDYLDLAISSFDI